MKLKIVLSVLLVAILFASCSQQPANSNPSYIDIPSPVDKIEWGMSESDCLDALGLTEDQVTAQTTEGDTVTVVLPDQMDVYGFPAQVLLEFCGEVKDVELGLISMRFDFGKDVDLEKLKGNISAALGDSVTLNGGRWESVKSKADVPEEIQAEYFQEMPGLPDESMKLGTVAFDNVYHLLADSNVLTIHNISAVLVTKALENK